jgi:hypothetical protein
LQFVAFYLFSRLILTVRRRIWLAGRTAARDSVPPSLSRHGVSAISPVNTNPDTCCKIDSDTVSTCVSSAHRAVLMLHAPICLHIYIAVGVCRLIVHDLCFGCRILRTRISSAFHVPKWIPSILHQRKIKHPSDS